MYFTISRAGLLGKRYRARLFAGNNELVWFTQTYSRKEDAHTAIDLLGLNYQVHDQT